MRSMWAQSSADKRHGRIKARPRHSFAGPVVKAGVGVLVLTAIAAFPSQAGQSDVEFIPNFAQSKMTSIKRLDAELANACVRSGRTKSECVCVVKTLRGTVQATDYVPSAKLQTAAYANSGEVIRATKISLEKSGVSPMEILALERQRRNLIKTQIEPVCSAAQTSNSPNL